MRLKAIFIAMPLKSIIEKIYSCLFLSHIRQKIKYKVKY